MGDGAQAACIMLPPRLLDLLLEIARQLAAELAFDDPPRRAIGDAEKAIEHLLSRDWIVVPR